MDEEDFDQFQSAPVDANTVIDKQPMQVFMPSTQQPFQKQKEVDLTNRLIQLEPIKTQNMQIWNTNTIDLTLGMHSPQDLSQISKSTNLIHEDDYFTTVDFEKSASFPQPISIVNNQQTFQFINYQQNKEDAKDRVIQQNQVQINSFIQNQPQANNLIIDNTKSDQLGYFLNEKPKQNIFGFQQIPKNTSDDIFSGFKVQNKQPFSFGFENIKLTEQQFVYGQIQQIKAQNILNKQQNIKQNTESIQIKPLVLNHFLQSKKSQESDLWSTQINLQTISNNQISSFNTNIQVHLQTQHKQLQPFQNIFQQKNIVTQNIQKQQQQVLFENPILQQPQKKQIQQCEIKKQSQQFQEFQQTKQTDFISNPQNSQNQPKTNQKPPIQEQQDEFGQFQQTQPSQIIPPPQNNYIQQHHITKIQIDQHKIQQQIDHQAKLKELYKLVQSLPDLSFLLKQSFSV